ncbi:MAG: FtsX-like permease family protein [Actinomycetota bacterium]
MTLRSLRPTARIAWRQARRARGRTALIVAMIALPVAGVAAVSSLTRTGEPTVEERATAAMGSTDLLINEWDGPGPFRPARVEAVLPPGSTVASIRGLSTEMVVRGRYTQIFFEELPPPSHRAITEGRYAILRGRAPARVGEVAVAPAVLDAFGIHVGDELQLRKPHLSLHVVGEAVLAAQLSWKLALVDTGQLRGLHATQIMAWAIDLPAGADTRAAIARLHRAGVKVETRTQAGRFNRKQRLLLDAVTFGLGTIALVGTALIVAAAFLVGAIRQLRTLGLVGAAGGEPRHLRGVVVLGGVVLGLLGSVVGVVIGIGVAFAIHPILDRLADRVTGAIEIPVPELLGAVVLGTLACAAAAYLPARIAARIPTVEALAGRTPPPRRPGRLAGVGLVVVGAGVLGLAFATVQRSVQMVAGAVVVTLAGFLFAIPLLVSWTGRLARWLPMTARLAARHAARHGRRTGAALAAATLALALPVAVSTMTLSSEGYEDRALPLADDQAFIGNLGNISVDPRAAASAGRAIRTRFPDATVATITWATYSKQQYPKVARNTQVYAVGGKLRNPDGTTSEAGGPVALASPALLRSLHAETGIDRIGTAPILAIGKGSTDRGFVELQDPSTGKPEAARRLRAEEIAGPRFDYVFPQYLIAPGRARRLGFAASVGGLVVRFPGPLDGSSVAALRDIAAAHPGLFSQTDADFRPNAATARGLLTLGSTFVAILVLSIAVALVSAESRRDHAILVAVGAEPRIRRRIVGANALVLAGLAGLLAIPAGFVPAAVIQLVRAAPYPIVVPWETCFAVGVATPLLTGTLAALCSRQPKSSALMQPAF